MTDALKVGDKFNLKLTYVEQIGCLVWGNNQIIKRFRFKLDDDSNFIMQKHELHMLQKLPDEETMTKFKVGQVWRTGIGKLATIASLNSKIYGFPIQDTNEGTYDLNGVASHDHQPSAYDLIELVKDVEETKEDEAINLIQQLAKQRFDQVMAQRTEIITAFITKYGIEPEQCIQIEERQPDGTTHWYIKKRKEDEAVSENKELKLEVGRKYIISHYSYNPYKFIAQDGDDYIFKDCENCISSAYAIELTSIKEHCEPYKNSFEEIIYSNNNQSSLAAVSRKFFDLMRPIDITKDSKVKVTVEELPIEKTKQEPLRTGFWDEA